MNQKGFIGFLVLIILLLLGIGLSVYLSQKPQQIKSDASESAPVVFNVKDFGAKGDGVSDDTEAIQKAIDEADLITNSLVFLPNGTFKISRLNFTHKDYITFAGVAQTGTHLISFVSDGEGGILDLTGANSIILERFDLVMEPNKTAAAGILIARSKYRSCSHNTLNNVGVYSRSQGGEYDFNKIGTWTVAPVFVYGCDYLTFFHPIIYNGVPNYGKGAVILTAINEYDMSSTFTDIGVGDHPANGYRFYQAEIHNFVYSALGSLVLNTVSDITLYGGPYSSFQRPNIYIKGGVSKLHVYGTTLYSEVDTRLDEKDQIQRVPQFNIYIADDKPVNDLILDNTTCQHSKGLFGGSPELVLNNLKINCTFQENEPGYIFNIEPSSNPGRVFLKNSFFMVPKQNVKPPATIGGDVTFMFSNTFEMPLGATDNSKKIRQ